MDRLLQNVGNYDFRDEVNVEVLGHIFEKSIGELEELRPAACLRGGAALVNGGRAAHAKVARAEALRHLLHAARIHRFIAQNTIEAVIEAAISKLRRGARPDRRKIWKPTQPSPTLPPTGGLLASPSLSQGL